MELRVSRRSLLWKYGLHQDPVICKSGNPHISYRHRRFCLDNREVALQTACQCLFPVEFRNDPEAHSETPRKISANTSFFHFLGILGMRYHCPLLWGQIGPP